MTLSINDRNFNRNITKKFNKFMIPEDKPTFKEYCFPNKFQYQIPQKFLSEFINPDTPYKGILIFHKIGAGKTCTAVNICEKWKKKKNIIVVLPASLKSNFRGELRSLCAGENYISNKDRERLKKLNPKSDEYKSIIAKSDILIDKYYKIYSYNKFVEGLKDKKIKLNNTLLVIDEVQNIVSLEGSYYSIIKNAIDKSPTDLRIVLMSATPMFDKPIEIGLTMNLLKIPNQFPEMTEFNKMFLKMVKNKNSVEYDIQNIDLFKKMIKGYISYYKGAPDFVFPKETIKYVKCNMSDYQYQSYLTVLEQSSNNSKNIDLLNLPTNFLLGPRLISNISFPNKLTNEEGYKAFKISDAYGDKLKRYSIKFYKIIKSIKKSTGPVFVYSNFRNFGGIKSFEKALIAYGYSSYVTNGVGKNRYVILAGSSTEPKNFKQEITAVFNNPNNIDGEKLKIIIGSPSIKEGISFFNIQQIHILEPYWNYSRILQIIGRGSRFCSHKLLTKQDRFVDIFIYIATHKNEKETIDEYIMKLALNKHKLIKKFELAMKESAVDCQLFYNGNKTKGEKIKCDN